VVSIHALLSLTWRILACSQQGRKCLDGCVMEQPISQFAEHVVSICPIPGGRGPHQLRVWTSQRTGILVRGCLWSFIAEGFHSSCWHHRSCPCWCLCSYSHSRSSAQSREVACQSGVSPLQAVQEGEEVTRHAGGVRQQDPVARLLCYASKYIE
jgi:hypothetical protein